MVELPEARKKDPLFGNGHVPASAEDSVVKTVKLLAGNVVKPVNWLRGTGMTGGAAGSMVPVPTLKLYMFMTRRVGLFPRAASGMSLVVGFQNSK
jgi:hypothetical protein